MKNKKQSLFLSLAILIFGLSVSGSIIFAQNDLLNGNIQYPISELGGCENKDDCKEYCDNSQNFDACISFAEKNNLMPKGEIKTAKKFMAGGVKGPGGCGNKNKCEAYCDNIDNISECVSFAEENNILPPGELEEIKKVKAAIERGIKPPACRNKKQCDSYCASPEHMEECLVFAEAAGFIPPKELDEAKKVLEAVKKGIKPPACRGKEECDIYCSEESHFNECIVFAEAAGFMRPEEVEMARKTKGKGPGGCRGREECDAFCQNETNMETCANFALEHGLMKPEEVEMMRKTGGKSPGNCRGKEECEAFCNNPENQETCFQFSKEHNLIPPEEMEKMKEGMGQMKENLQMAPPEISECLKSNIGEEVLNKIQSGTFAPSRDIGEKMRNCFENFKPQRPDMPQQRPDNSSNMTPPSDFKGPRECQSPEECGQGGEQNFEKRFEGTIEELKRMPPVEMLSPNGFMPSDYRPEGEINNRMPFNEYIKPPEGEGYIPQMPSQEETRQFQQYPLQYQQMMPPQEIQQMPYQQVPQEYIQRMAPPQEMQTQEIQPQEIQQTPPPPPSSMNKQKPFAQILYFFTRLFEGR